MQYDVIGAMPARRMLEMFKYVPVADFEHVERYGLDVSNYSYKSSLAASLLRQNDKGEVTVYYKVIGEMSLGVPANDIREALNRNDNILIFHHGKERVYSAIAYRGGLCLDTVEALCKQISDSIRPRDSQRKKVYAFCVRVSPRFGNISEKEAVALVNKVIADYGIPKNRVLFQNDFDSQKFDGVCYTVPFDVLHTIPAMNVINIRNIYGMSRDTVIHELAHMVVRYEYENDSALGHGPGFVALFIELLAKYGFEKPQRTQREYVDLFVRLAEDCGVAIDKHCILIDDGWYAPKPKARIKKIRRPNL